MKLQEKTLQYYSENAYAFVSETSHADMSANRGRFLHYLPKGGVILDWGCGSGRDSLAFQKAGYHVEATDASKELCQIASESLEQTVRCEHFDELDKTEEYDGIWACASLLHIERSQLPEVLKLAEKSLKTGGVIYTSFKYGDFEGERGGRFFLDMTEKRFEEIINGIRGLEVIDQWISTDVRTDRDQKWLNSILRKQ